MKKIALYGGSFNPPHIGHYNAARRFYEAIGADEMIIIPSFIPPHKIQSDFAAAESRVRMCELTFGNLENTSISDVEIRRGGKSYTYLTLQELSSPNAKLYFLVGTDMLLTLDEWKNPDKIFEYATICYVRREKDDSLTKEIDEKIRQLQERYNARIIEIEAESIELSSSDIREKVRLGEDISPYVTADVLEYIRSKGIYL